MAALLERLTKSLRIEVVVLGARLPDDVREGESSREQAAISQSGVEVEEENLRMNDDPGALAVVPLTQ
jgi:hypothetical protein